MEMTKNVIPLATTLEARAQSGEKEVPVCPFPVSPSRSHLPSLTCPPLRLEVVPLKSS